MEQINHASRLKYVQELTAVVFRLAILWLHMIIEIAAIHGNQLSTNGLHLIFQIHLQTILGKQIISTSRIQRQQEIPAFTSFRVLKCYDQVGFNNFNIDGGHGCVIQTLRSFHNVNTGQCTRQFSAGNNRNHAQKVRSKRQHYSIL